MDPLDRHLLMLTRRQWLGNVTRPLGAAAIASMWGADAKADPSGRMSDEGMNGLPGLPHFAPTARRVIYLVMAGGPSHIDLFDYKPSLRDLHGEELPDSVRGGQRITGMTSGQESFPCVAPMFDFQQYGRHGTWVSELLPHIAGVVDELAIIKSVHTEAINHDPGITFINTGSQQPGRPSIGSWISYGLGSPNRNLPSFIVMISRGPGQKQALYNRLWGSGFLPSKHQGVTLRGSHDPVLYLSNPEGIDRDMRRRMLNRIEQLNHATFERFGDPETHTRIAQYEMAFRMQQSVPDLMDLSGETECTFRLYGPDAHQPGTFARNCLLARRLAEQGVPFVQLFHEGWDQHFALPKNIRGQCESMEQGAAALIQDLKQRGMLEDTLVVWAGEFGRTIYSQGKLTKTDHGRDHHGRCFTVWLAGGGVKPGIEYGATDDFCYNVIDGPVHIRDLNATILHCLGIQHQRLTFPFQGLEQRLTGVEPARVVTDVLL